jgi:protocatechuate 3,4-dioxygenase alpha subunit
MPSEAAPGVDAGGPTPSQTVGPFFAFVLTPTDYEVRPIVSDRLWTEDADGERIRLEGYILDGDDEPIVDAMIEVWQADGRGRYPGPGGRGNTAFTGFGRAEVDSTGLFSFETVRPGAVPGPDGVAQAPHINLGIFARGLLRRLATRVYFEGEAANKADPILALVPPERRSTLVASRLERGGDKVFHHVIRLQGEDETVFFDL